MKKIIAVLAALLCLSLCCAASAENQYFFVEQGVEIVDAGEYTAVVHAGTDGWEWSISENKDITAWIVKEDDSPAFIDEAGIATAHMEYGPCEGSETDVAAILKIDLDMSKVTGFTENGAFDIYLRPLGKDAIWACGKNHGQYVTCKEKLGTVHIPSVTVDGLITGISGQPLEQDTVTVKMEMDGFDSSLLSVGDVQLTILEGDGYYPYNYSISGEMAAEWAGGECTVTVSELTGKFGMQGGDGNGHYNLRIGVTGLTYNGLPIAQPIIRTDIYSFGRTFLSDHGSLIWFAEPKWVSEDAIPELCDVYPDFFTAIWPVGMDASGVKTEDVTITLVSAYGDEKQLIPGEDFTIFASANKTEIVTTYINWAYTPVFTKLRVEINAANVVRDAQMYADTAVFSHEYDIASVYAFSEMGGGPSGAQGWTYYGFANLTDPLQVFCHATYSLTMTDDAGNTWFYGEDENGNGILVAAEADGVSFIADEECNLTLNNQQVCYTRQYDQTEVKTVNGEEITFSKRYVKCEVLPRSIADLDESLELLPGYALGKGWEDHLKWPWQSFINIGYMSNNK